VAADATVDTYDAVGNVTKKTSPLPAGQTGPNPYETTTYSYDESGNLIEVAAPPASTSGQNLVMLNTYNSAGELAAETTGYGTSDVSIRKCCERAFR